MAFRKVPGTAFYAGHGSLYEEDAVSRGEERARPLAVGGTARAVRQGVVFLAAVKVFTNWIDTGATRL